MFAQEFRDEFETLGIEPDDYAVSIDAEGHQGTVHAYDRETGSRNPEWTAFFEQAEEEGWEVSREEAVEMAEGLVAENGWESFDMHAYQDDSTATSLSDLTVEAAEPADTGSATDDADEE